MKRQRFIYLDGMRGIAALSVASLHASIGFNLYYRGHGYLAVDFFFCLSGFIVAHAYEARIAAGMSFSKFLIRRLIRLYPMIFASLIIGAVAYYWRAPTAQMTLTAPAIIIILSGFFLIPSGLLFQQQAFPTNGPLWSLFFEIFANFLYFFEAKIHPKRFINSCFLLAFFGTMLGLSIHRIGSVTTIGFASPESFMLGFDRVLYSFLAGIIICRFVPYKNLLQCPSLLLSAFLIPILFLPAGEKPWLYDTTSILLLFPLIVTLGANVADQGHLSKFWLLLGQISYPLYAVHEPVLRGMYRMFHDTSAGHQSAVLLAAVSLCAAIIVSGLFSGLYDQPLRRWLTRHFIINAAT